MSIEVEVLADDDFASLVGSRLTKAMAGHGDIRMCLATGNTTRPIYQQTSLAGDPAIFLLDEFGGLPPGDPGRCESSFLRDFPEARFQAPDVDSADPESAAAAYGEQIHERGIDLAVVGLGRNGHIGMNEPGSNRDSVTRVVELEEATRTGAMAYGASTKPSWGITVGIAELMEARELWLVVTGSHKSEILEATLRGTVGSHLPATYLRHHPNARTIADVAAAERL
ncbi:MAG: 6-phosphogluconolactonase [Actinomycetota bacterium]|nr:6-phosphogluconolactonase [Actinomycetota bacterium]